MPKWEPVRWFAVASAIVALVAHYVPDLPVALIVAVLAAIFGVGSEITRNAVVPVAKLSEEQPQPPAPAP